MDSFVSLGNPAAAPTVRAFPGIEAFRRQTLADPQPHDNDYDAEVDPTKARLDLLSAYSMRGKLHLDGLLLAPAEPWTDDASPVIEPSAPRDDESYHYKSPGEKVWTAA